MKIVGVADIDMQSRYARTGVFLPMKFAQGLHAMQGSDLRATAAPTYRHADRAREGSRPGAES